MTLREKFKHNPFENQVAAGAFAAKFPLRGHEEALEVLLSEISSAIDYPDYPATAQHTIVFGEWGHGKSHVLRTLESRINAINPQRAQAVFFEPSDSDPERIFVSLCELLQVDASSPAAFIDSVRNKFPENLFLLMDETQAIVGEHLSETYEKNLRKYWQFLGKLQQAASDKLYGLHVFHGLSANSARSISKIGQIPAVKQFARRVFSLRSLDENEQWQMYCDHLKDAVPVYVDLIEDVISRGVSTSINQLTGGNPRYALALMGQVFRFAWRQNADQIDGSHCFLSLSEVPRFDASGSHYFDRHAIHELVEDLKNGQQFEKRIANMIQKKIGSILGEWASIDQAELADFELTSATVRKRCESLRTPAILFEQRIGETDFRPTPEFFRIVNVARQNSLTDASDKNLLLSLQLEPETKIFRMEQGLQQIMTHNNRYGSLNELQTNRHELQGNRRARVFITDLSGEKGQRLRIGFAIFKGREIPKEVFHCLLDEIEAGKCTAIIYIEDADTRHNLPGSSFDLFCNSYRGDLDLKKRFLFINNTNSQTDTFDEDFFVKLVKSEISEEESREWFSRLRITDVLDVIKEDCVYCPSHEEQLLISDLIPRKRTFRIGEIRELDARYQWVSSERLATLFPYISKSGSNYVVCKPEEVSVFKFVLGQLQESSGLSQEELDKRIRTRYILTGDTASISGYAGWLLSVLVQHNEVLEDEDVFKYKDLNREFSKLNSRYSRIGDEARLLFGKYDAAQIDVASMRKVRENLELISEEASTWQNQGSIAVLIEKLQIAIEDYANLLKTLKEIPDEARAELQGQLKGAKALFNIVESKAKWPYDDLENPYEILYGLAEIRNDLQGLERDITADIPLQQRCRKRIVDAKSRLDALSVLLDSKIRPGIFASEEELDSCIFDICNALRDFRNAIVRITLNSSLE